MGENESESGGDVAQKSASNNEVVCADNTRNSIFAKQPAAVRAWDIPIRESG